MAKWLYEAGIGENRAVLLDDGRIVEAEIELPGEVSAGAVLAGRLREILIPGRRGLVESGKQWVVVEPLPPTLTKGQAVRVLIVRSPIAEPDNSKYAKGRITEEEERDGPRLLDRIGEYTPVLATDPDLLEQAGWSELIEEAISGDIPFAGGGLRMSLTPAMTLFDVDGSLTPAALAIAGAAAAGRATRRMGIGGSIGIDLPTLAARDERQAAAAALDAVLPQPFERTAVNGFGFLQVVRRRERESLPERLQFNPISASARALLRRAERVPGVGARHLVAAPAVIAYLETRRDWLEELARRMGRSISLQANPGFTTWTGHVQSAHS